jgi:FKBP-type peptidyl-prolyl cis-trans isomerase SlyD
MQISYEKVVGIHYTLRDGKGEVLDSSVGHDPLYYLHGHGNIIPGLENQLEGKELGHKMIVVVAPEEGYGLRDEDAVQQVPIASFGGSEVAPGMQFRAGNENGQYVVTVVEVTPEMVTVDGNHPLAGVELHFDVEITDIREATEEEIAHGHVHGPGGHHH